MKPVSIAIRGAIGIYDGMGLDEISIDFTVFQPGIIAIVGGNGSGKTTILENLHPYRQLASRAGSLADHYRLRDSYRDYTCQFNGHIYRCNILIDAQTGKQEAYLTEDGKPLNDGKVTTYDAAVVKVFGSADLFFKSIFAAQETESITSLTAGKRKDLFMEFLNLTVADRYAAHAKERGEAVEKETAEKNARLAQITVEVAEKEKIEAGIFASKASLEDAEDMLDVMGEGVKRDRDTLTEIERQIVAQQGAEARMETLQTEIAGLRVEQERNDREYTRASATIKAEKHHVYDAISRTKAILSNTEEIGEKVKSLTMLRSQADRFAGELAKVQEIEGRKHRYEMERAAAVSAYTVSYGTLQKEEHTAHTDEQNYLLDIGRQVRVAENDLASAKRRAALANEVPCKDVPGLPATCKLLKDAMQARDSVAELEARIAEMQGDAYLRRNGYTEIVNRLTDVQKRMRELARPADDTDKMAAFTAELEAVDYDPDLHEAVKQDIKELEAKRWEELQAECAVAASVLKEKEAMLDSFTARERELGERFVSQQADVVRRAKAFQSEYDGLAGTINPAIVALRNATVKDVREGEARLEAQQNTVADYKGRIAAAQGILDRIEELANQAEQLEQEVAGLNRRAEAWKVLQRACGRDGYPALELDAAAPAISRIANDLLAGTFGTRFQIAFVTTEPTKDGKKIKEVFDIKVFSGDSEKVIENLSVGQRTWVERAIREAISIYMSEKSGKEYLTAFADEADGPLDPDNRQHFLDMIRESFKVGRRHYTFLISQNTEITGQIGQQIRLDAEAHTLNVIA